MEEEKLGSIERRDDTKECRKVLTVGEPNQTGCKDGKGQEVRKGKQNKRCNKSREARRKVWVVGRRK